VLRVRRVGVAAVPTFTAVFPLAGVVIHAGTIATRPAAELTKAHSFRRLFVGGFDPLDVGRAVVRAVSDYR